MSAINTLIYLYLCGVTGFMVGAVIFKFPRNLNDFEEILDCSIIWPLFTFHSYTRRVEQQAQKLHQQNVRSLIAEIQHRERLLQIMTKTASQQNKEYQELLEKYNKIKKPELVTQQKESANPKGKRDNEPL